MSRVGEYGPVGGPTTPPSTEDVGGPKESPKVGDPNLTVGREGTALGGAGGLDSLFDTNGNFNSNALENVPFKLEGLSKASSDIFAIMALIVQMGIEQRQGAREARDAQNILQQMELHNAADEIRKAADMALASAIVSGVFKMVSAGISVGGGLKGLHDLNKASKVSEDAHKATKGLDDAVKTPKANTAADAATSAGATNRPRSDATASKSADKTSDASKTVSESKSKKADQKTEEKAREAELQKYQNERAASEESMRQTEIVRNKGRAYDGTSQLVSTTGEVIGAVLTRESAEHNAKQKEAEARATEAASYSDRENEFAKNLDETINKVSSLIGDVQQSVNESYKRIIF